MKFRRLATITTLILLIAVIYFGRNQIIEAWGLVGSVDIWLFILIFPFQVLSYYAAGEVLFSYLRAKGELKNMSRMYMARIALELNFVDHIVPIPSIAGFSYLSWILKHHDVKISRSSMAQVLRYVIKFSTFVTLMLISIIILAFDSGVNRTMVVCCSLLVVVIILVIAIFLFCISNPKRLKVLSRWICNLCNGFIWLFTFGKKKNTVKCAKLNKFFVEMHDDYLEIRQDKRILIKPILWGFFENLLDVFLILIAFLALGHFVNPAILFVASGISSSAAIFFATPGGSGAYEAIMIAFLISAGVPAEIAIAGTLLARATLFSATILFGYVFYQISINKYGRIEK